MAKRNCPTLQKSLDWCEGMPSHPGVRRRVYFCNKNLIVAYPTLPRDEFGRPTAAILEGNFELADGAYWQYLDINIDKSTVTSEPQGEVPSQTQLNKATFVHNGIDEEATAAAGWLNNSDNVYIVEDMPGKFRVLGNNKWRTKTTVNQDMGQGTNPASTTINVEVTDEVAAPFYFGSIETEDGTVTPDAVVTPYVSTKSLNMTVGQTAQIVFGPKDGKWSFSSSSTRTATVDGNGLITAVAQGSSNITCMYNGETVHTVTVGVGFVAGDDEGGDDEQYPEEAPTVTPETLHLFENSFGKFNLSPADGWELSTTDDIFVDNQGNVYVEEEGGDIIATHGNVTKEIGVIVMKKTILLDVSENPNFDIGDLYFNDIALPNHLDRATIESDDETVVQVAGSVLASQNPGTCHVTVHIVATGETYVFNVEVTDDKNAG